MLKIERKRNSETRQWLLNEQGFTLAELLIVVAIIGVLVAISIPIFTSQLEKAREATDASNIRSKYAEMLVEVITGDRTESSLSLENSEYKVQGVQKKNGWQTEVLKTALPLVQDNEPVADGICTLYYADGQAHCTWSGGSSSGGNPSGGSGSGSDVNPGGSSGAGGAGSGTVTPGGSSGGGNEGSGTVKPGGSESGGAGSGTVTPGGSSGSGSDTGDIPGSPDSVIGNLQTNAKPWGTAQNMNTSIGEVFSYDGQIYIALDSGQKYTGGEGGGGHPGPGGWYQWNFVQPSGTVFSSKDVNSSGVIQTKISYGDLYVADDGTVYICKGNSDWGLSAPSKTEGNWVAIQK